MRLIRLLKLAAFALVIAVLLVGFYISKVEPDWIEVKEQPVFISDLPAHFQGFRIIQLSDLHGKPFLDREIAAKVNRLKPDIVVITGDLFDESEEVPLKYAEQALSGLQAQYGTYFVFGNNDSYLDKQEVKKELSRIGIKTLLNERLGLKIKGQQIDLVGIDDLYSTYVDLPKVLEGSAAEPKILLSHTPEVVNLAADAGIDLILSGHTHGGQIAVPFLNWRLANVSEGYEKYIMGLFKVGKTQIYVNRGLGENYMNARFLTRPEITAISLYCK